VNDSFADVRMFTCSRCVNEASFTDLRKLLTHITLCHAHEPNFYYSCTVRNGGQDCSKSCKSVAAYKLHVYREHRDLLSVSRESQTPGKICCPSCGTKLDSLLSLSAHYRTHCDMGHKVVCVIRGCNDEFSVYSSYTSHMSRLHRNDKNINNQYVHNDSTDSHHINMDHDIENESVGNELDPDAQDEYKKHFALLLLKLQEQCMLPNATVQIIFDSIKELIALTVENMQENVKNVCQENKIAPELYAEIVSSVRHSVLENAMNDLSTDWKRKRYYKEKFNYVEPLSIRFDKTNPLTTESFQYVPILDSLHTMLKNEEVLSQVLKPSFHKPNIISSFSDGSVFCNHPVFQAHSSALRLVIYSDEFDVVNPIGVHATIHKMLAFYYTLENISEHLKSKRDAIQLLAICNSSDVKRFGLKAVADIISQDVKQLEQSGITISGKKLYGSIAYITGDNLNSHMIGGFNGSFGPKVFRPCRFCMTTSSEVQTVIEAHLLQLRTCSSYNEQTAIIEMDPSQKATFGIRYESPFNQGTFHVVGRLPPDILHDLLEGTVPLEMALVLQQLVAEGCFTVQQLNLIINSWPYGTLDRQNKPVALGSVIGDKIRQNAGRMWCLLRLLPLMIGPMIPKLNPYWSFLLELKDIVEIVFAYKLSTTHVHFLLLKIQDHLASFQDLFPSRRLLPKHHFMLHYPSLISSLGPLRLAWCMRFESKHSYFVKLGKTVNNFKSLSSTFAVRHQLKQAYCSTGVTGMCAKEINLSKSVDVDVGSLATPTCELLMKSGISLDRTIVQCRFVRLNEMLYYKNMFVVIGFKHGLLVFGQIRDIFVQNLAVRFLLRVFTGFFCSHLSAFALHSTTDQIVMKCEEFVDYYPLTAYNVDGTKYVVLKNFVFDDDEYSQL